MTEEKTPTYQYLTKVNSPHDLKQLSIDELKILCDELRSYIIETVEKTGGHLAPSLGTVELTVALHYVYDTPADSLIWDVGHQAYAHKVITGRRESLKTIRQYNGISGFCKRSESEYDAFGAGHASTSISAAVGFAAARDMAKTPERVVAIIGDGSFTGGLAYEGLNNVCNIKGQFLTILNDNEMSISPNVGAMSKYFGKILRSPEYLFYKNRIWDKLEHLPHGAHFIKRLVHLIFKPIREFFAPSVLFEDFSLRYYGPVDGHDLPRLIETLKNLRDLPYPVMLHIKTVKGKGLKCAENDPTKYHGIGPSKNTPKSSEAAPPFLKAFGKIACDTAKKNDKAVFITAAMKDGTGLVEFSQQYPNRYFDVGIAEGHAVTFAAGLASKGFRPVAAIYSTFLQRAYDNIMHDVALQKLPVIFALDRAGLVGEDGPTHHGAFDLSYLLTVPGLIVTAPRSGDELRDLMNTAFAQDEAPFAIRYPKASCQTFDENGEGKTVAIGKWQVLNEGKKAAIISTGVMTNAAESALEILKEKNISPTLIHAGFVKPWDKELFDQIINTHDFILTVEENSINGGLGMMLSQYMTSKSNKVKIQNLAIPDEFIVQGKRDIILKDVGLTAENIADIIEENC